MRTGRQAVLRPLDLLPRVAAIAFQPLRAPIRLDGRLEIAGRLQCPPEREMRAGGVRGVGHGLLEHLDRERGEASPGEKCAELQGAVEGRPGSGARADRPEPVSRRVGAASTAARCTDRRASRRGSSYRSKSARWRAGWSSPKTGEASASTSEVPLYALAK